mmetsp:Transcript_29662/g.59619  ORF Transcript_29662/g.59619 Transcript_29662/m.59619 type:complete len:450 (+) Transcript_29662:126-1475(+)
MNVISSLSMHPLYRISTAVEDGQELQLRWTNTSYSEDENEQDYNYDGNIECVYNEGGDITATVIKYHHPPPSIESAATISTCDSSSLDTTSSSSLSSQQDCDDSSLNIVRVDDHHSDTSEEEEEQEDAFELQQQQHQDDEKRALCPVTGHYSNFNDHYYIHSSSSSSSSILGIGQYGQVQSCIQISTGKAYAVKTIQKSPQLHHHHKHIQREIHLLTKLTSHPHILKLVDFHEDKDHVHIITERYTGGELFDVIGEHTSSSGCLTEGYAAGVIKCVLEAVEYLHSVGIVHRDLKPENLMFEYERNEEEEEHEYDHFDSSNSIRLIDFGLSREYNFKVDGYMSNPVGTSYYMAPELLKGKYTQSCDIWSVGIITYILLCGYPPFNGDDEEDIKRTIMEHGNAKNVNFKLRGWAGKSEEAKDFIKCLLRRDPGKRFTAEEALMHPWLKMYC